MNDTSPSPTNEAKSPAPKVAGRWIKIALALSLAANLGIAGLVVGAAVKFHRDGGPMGGPRDLAFGPYTEALSPGQRRALFRGIAGGAGDFGKIRREVQDDMQAVLAALTTQPFDQAAFQQALSRQADRLAGRVADGQRALVDLVSGMTDAERAEFARNLAERVKRGHRN